MEDPLRLSGQSDELLGYRALLFQNSKVCGKHLLVSVLTPTKPFHTAARLTCSMYLSLFSHSWHYELQCLQPNKKGVNTSWLIRLCL